MGEAALARRARRSQRTVGPRLGYGDTVSADATQATQSESRLDAGSGPSAPIPGVLLLFSERTPLFRPLTLAPGVPVRFGRNDIGGIKVPDTRVSKEHLELRFQDGVFTLEDLESMNGSFLDGERFQGRRTARSGAVLRVAHTVMLLLDDVRRFLATEVRRQRLPGPTPREVVIGPSLQEAFDLASVARQRGANLLILGENGTGKELVAEQFHRAGAPKGPFIAVNSAAITSSLADGLLFGTKKGVATAVGDNEGLVVAADGGVLFLDEIVELSAEVQVRLLRVVQSGEVLRMGDTTPRHVSVKFVTASHQDLRQRAADGRFREDLYFRLNQSTVTLRPLRERREEIAALMQLDIEEAGADALPLHVTAVEQAVLRSWPGNLRELRASVREAHAAAVVAKDNAVRARHFNDHAGRQLVASAPVGRAAVGGPGAAPPPVPETRMPTKEEVVAALEANGGNVSAAARQLELFRTQLNRLRKRYGLISADEPDPAA